MAAAIAITDKRETEVPRTFQFIMNKMACRIQYVHFTHENLSCAQKSMKENFDKRSENILFSPGDRVYMQTLIRKSLEARFESPYIVLRRYKDNYVVSTTTKRSKEKLVHTNLSFQIINTGGDQKPFLWKRSPFIPYTNAHNVDKDLCNTEAK